MRIHSIKSPSILPYAWLLLIIGALTFISCDKEEEANPKNASVSSVNDFLRNKNGIRISTFIEDGINKTPQFSTYLFTFNENGTVTATQTNETVSGTYLVFRDDNRTELRMNFVSGGILAELSDDWYFMNETGNTIRFEDDGDTLNLVKQ